MASLELRPLKSLVSCLAKECVVNKKKDVWFVTVVLWNYLILTVLLPYTFFDLRFVFIILIINYLILYLMMGEKNLVNFPLVAKKKYKNEKILIILYEQKLCMVCVWFCGNNPQLCSDLLFGTSLLANKGFVDMRNNTTTGDCCLN